MAGLEISAALYGDLETSKAFVDVTDKIKTKIWPDKTGISLRVSAANIGVKDPAPGKVKTLEVTYAINGETKVERVLDSQTFSVQVPGTTPKSGLEQTASVYSVLWTSAWGAGSIFVLVLTTAFAYQLGVNGYASWIFLVIVVLMLPYVGIGGIVVVVLIHTAIMGEFVAFKQASMTSRVANFVSKGIRNLSGRLSQRTAMV